MILSIMPSKGQPPGRTQTGGGLVGSARTRVRGPKLVDRSRRLASDWPLVPLPRKALLRQRRLIGLHPLVLVLAELAEVIPGVKTCVVHIVEDELHCIMTDELDLEDFDGGLAGDDRLLAGMVALHFGRGAFDSQQLGRQGEARAVLDGDIQDAAVLGEAQLRRPG